jgi:hypothetical protein
VRLSKPTQKREIGLVIAAALAVDTDLRTLETSAGASDPGGLRYMTLRFGENNSEFAHIAVVDTANNPLPETAAFKEFPSELKGRCVKEPNPVEAHIVGSYGFGGAGGA